MWGGGYRTVGYDWLLRISFWKTVERETVWRHLCFTNYNCGRWSRLSVGHHPYISVDFTVHLATPGWPTLWKRRWMSQHDAVWVQPSCLSAPSVSVWHLLGSRSAVWHVAGQNLKLVHPRFQVKLHPDHWGVRERVTGQRCNRETYGGWKSSFAGCTMKMGTNMGTYQQVSAVCLLDWPLLPNWPEFQLCRYQLRKGLQQLRCVNQVIIC